MSDGVVTLRPPDHVAAEACYAAVIESLPELTRWIPWAHEGYAMNEVTAWIQQCETGWATEEGNREFFIFGADGVFLGGAGLMRRADHGEIGYWVRTSAHRRGVATAAARLIRSFAREIQLEPLILRIDPANAASIGVAEKLGAVRARELETHVHEDGSRHELARFQLG